jgi:hypothetical protein
MVSARVTPVTVADDGSRWRLPDSPHGSNAGEKNGPAASELAADAHHCIMVRVLRPTEYKDVARTFVHHNRAPLDLIIPTTASLPSCSKPSRPSLAVAAGLAASLDRSCARRRLEV